MPNDDTRLRYDEAVERYRRWVEARERVRSPAGAPVVSPSADDPATAAAALLRANRIVLRQ